MSDFLRILVILLLVLGNAVFVAAEYALVTARRSRLEPEAAGGSRGAQAALARMDNPVGFISTVQIGITVFGIALGAVGESLLSAYFDPWLSNGLAFTESALTERPRSGYEVSLDLFGADLKPASRRFAVAETLSHLERLVLEERAERSGDVGVVAYTARQLGRSL